jgi:hypothetical protein
VKHALQVSCVLAVGVAVATPARATVEDATDLAGASSHVIQPIGWSADERYVALRHFALQAEEDFEGGEPPEPCKGYLDHKGKRFRGTLELLIFDGNKLLERHKIQDGTGGTDEPTTPWPCTPFPVAKERLKKAKATLARLGIDKKNAGTTTTVDKKGLPGAAAPLDKVRVDERIKTITDEEDSAQASGKVSIGEKNGTGMRVVLRRKLAAEWTLMMAGSWSSGFGPVFVSPSRRRAVFVYEERFSSMRGGDTKPWVLGMVAWDGKKLVAP